MIWFRDYSKSMVLLSDNNNHDKTTVAPYTMHVLQIAMDTFGNEVKEIEIWTNGPSSQYKNKYLLYSLKLSSQGAF